MNPDRLHGLFLTALAQVSLLAAAAHGQPVAWKQTPTTLALLNGKHVIWRMVADPAQGKPYFHPLATPGGTVLTDLQPADHPWHRGLWWSWKLINDTNYWEDDGQFIPKVRTTDVTACKLEPHDDGSARMTFSLRYHPARGSPVMTERRTLVVSCRPAGRTPSTGPRSSRPRRRWCCRARRRSARRAVCPGAVMPGFPCGCLPPPAIGPAPIARAGAVLRRFTGNPPNGSSSGRTRAGGSDDLRRDITSAIIDALVREPGHAVLQPVAVVCRAHDARARRKTRLALPDRRYRP